MDVLAQTWTYASSKKGKQMAEGYQSRQYRERSRACAFCAKPLINTNASKEHIFPNAIGGRKTVNNFTCRDCNKATGANWDKELVKQLRPLCTMLNIKRNSGRNQPFEVETINDRKLTVRPDGSMTIARPIFDESDLGDKTAIKIQARNMKEFKRMVSDLQKKYPQIDVDEMLSHATYEREYSAEPYKISIEFGKSLAGRSVVKSCLALAYDAGLNINRCEHAESYLLANGSACFGYFNEYDVVKNRPARTFFHCVHVCGDPARKQILAYVEYFGWQRIVACLSSTYIGKAFSHSYAIDPITGRELDLVIDLKIEPDEIQEIYAYKKVNYAEVKRALGALVEVWMDQDRERATANAVEAALQSACAECGAKEGDMLSERKAAEFARAVTGSLEPFLWHLVSGSMLSAEDMQKIERKARDRDVDA